MIEKNMVSTDAFVRNLYTDLHDRIQNYEKEESDAKKMGIVDVVPEIAIIGVISAFLIFVIF